MAQHENLLFLGSGLLYVALGVWVLALGPRRRENRLLAAYAITFGAAFSVNVLLIYVQRPSLGPAFQTPLLVAAALAAVLLAVLVPRGAQGHRPRHLATPALLAVLAVALPVAAAPSVPPAMRLVQACEMFVLFALALAAHPSRGATQEERAQARWLAVALSLLPALSNGLFVVTLARGIEPTAASAEVRTPWFLLGLALWARNWAASDGRDATGARNVLLALLAVMTAGAFLGAASDVVSPGHHWTRGAVRTLGVILLVYAIVRSQLLGLDVKLRWTLSRTSVAALFVGIFFVGTEAAQTFFGDIARSEYVGILVAGMLLFAIAPLQRAADRLAASVLPVAPRPAGDRLREYRGALRVALADGPLSRDEERALARLQAELGLDAVAALEAREAVEEDLRLRGVKGATE